MFYAPPVVRPHPISDPPSADRSRIAEFGLSGPRMRPGRIKSPKELCNQCLPVFIRGLAKKNFKKMIFGGANRRKFDSK